MSSSASTPSSHIISLLNHSEPEVSASPGPTAKDDAVTGSEPLPAAQAQAQPPRKRSKVSRACDECRRKKIKCDAALNNITATTKLQCSNCSKTNEFCTFTRVPLKRGPTKGYIRDFEGKVDMENRRGSVPGTSHSSSNSHSSAASAGALQPPNPFKKDMFTHHLPPLPVSASAASANTIPAPPLNSTSAQRPQPPPIVLPPIDHSRSRATSNLTLSPRSSVPNIDAHHHTTIQAPSAVALLSGSASSSASSIGTAAAAGASASAAQGHFWKVPYEYSAVSNDRRGSADSLSSSISDSFSTPFYGSSSSTSKKPRVDSSSVVSDSDDEMYHRKSSLRSPLVSQAKPFAAPVSAQAAQAAQALQPHTAKTRSPDSLSISSLSSLNNKLNFGLNFENQHLKSPIDLKAVEANVMLYYENYHQNCFILPLNAAKFAGSIAALSLQSEVEIFTADLLNSSLLLLNNANKSSSAFIDDIRLVFQQIVKTYPLFGKDIAANEFWKLMFLSTLVILNYCTVLSGQDYSIGLNVNIGIFNDFKIASLVAELHNIRDTTLDYDDLIVIYSRLFFNLYAFDRLHAASYNKSTSLCKPVPQFPLAKMLPPAKLATYQYQSIVVESFQQGVSQQMMPLQQIRGALESAKAQQLPNRQDDVVLASWRDFCDVYDMVDDIKAHFAGVSRSRSNTDDDDEEEFIFDNFLKITRSVKKLTTQLSTIFDKFQQATSATGKIDLSIYSPLVLCVSFKILLALKNLIISIIKFQKKMGNHDLMSRLKKLELDLSSVLHKTFKNLNFENLNLLNNLNFINQRFAKNVQLYDLPSVHAQPVPQSQGHLYAKVDEWLKYLDMNFVKLINDDEYGWLL